MWTQKKKYKTLKNWRWYAYISNQRRKCFGFDGDAIFFVCSVQEQGLIWRRKKEDKVWHKYSAWSALDYGLVINKEAEKKSFSVDV